MPASLARPRPVTTLLAVVLCSTLALAGCGSGDPEAEPRTAKAVVKSSAGATPQAEAGPYAGMEPKEILELVASTTSDAQSVRVKAVYAEDPGPVKFSMRFVHGRPGRAGRAHGTMKDKASGTMRFTVIGKIGYIQYGKDMLQDVTDGDTAVVQVLARRWLKTPVNKGEFGELLKLLNMNAFINDLVDLSDTGGDLVKVKGRKYAGRDTIGLKEKGTPGIVYVAADGSGEMVAYKHPDANAIFEDWNKKFTIKAPTPAFNEDQFFTSGL